MCDVGGGESGVAEADERAVADGVQGGVTLMQPREQFLGDEEGEGRIAGAFAPPCFLAAHGDEDKPSVGESVAEFVDDARGLDAIAVEFAIEEDREVARRGGVARRANPNGALILEVGAAERFDGFRWRARGHGRAAGRQKGRGQARRFPEETWWGRD